MHVIPNRSGEIALPAAVAFDTRKFVRRLRDAGVDEKQAAALSDAFREVQEAQLQELATKGDILTVKQEIQGVKRDIKELEPRLAAEIAPLKWGMAVIAGGIIALILKTFFPH
ncbi:MAG: CCDC90 family protein [Magnetococcus sp. YQC-3]